MADGPRSELLRQVLASAARLHEVLPDAVLAAQLPPSTRATGTPSTTTPC